MLTWQALYWWSYLYSFNFKNVPIDHTFSYLFNFWSFWKKEIENKQETERPRWSLEAEVLRACQIENEFQEVCSSHALGGTHKHIYETLSSRPSILSDSSHCFVIDNKQCNKQQNKLQLIQLFHWITKDIVTFPNERLWICSIVKSFTKYVSSSVQSSRVE